MVLAEASDEIGFAYSWISDDDDFSHEIESVISFGLFHLYLLLQLYQNQIVCIVYCLINKSFLDLGEYLTKVWEIFFNKIGDTNDYFR